MKGNCERLRSRFIRTRMFSRTIFAVAAVGVVETVGNFLSVSMTWVRDSISLKPTFGI
jgi:hypothetical protein